MKQQYSQSKITVIGFLYGGHAALIILRLSNIVDTTFDLYGKNIAITILGSGSPRMELLSKILGKLTCISGKNNQLIPQANRTCIKNALRE